jgi:outer membrane protein assembly factor BamD (BamD/ComL family)
MFQLAKDLMEDGDYYGAATDFEALLYAYPNSSFAPKTKELLFESCYQLMLAGYATDVLGIEIPFIKTRGKGLKMLRAALARYPSEEFTPTFYMRLAEYFYNEREWEQAELEYRTIVELYPGSRYAADAKMGLARSAQRRFKGVDYDAEPLLEAKRQYEIVAKDYSQHEAIAQEAATKLKTIDEVLAQKDYEVAEFYMDRDLPGSARFYYKEVVRRFPQTRVALQANARLNEMGPEPPPSD